MIDLSRFNCRQCGNLHELTTLEMTERMKSPWTRRCSCGARYQLTKTENRLVEWGPGYVPPKRLPPLPTLPVLPPLPPL